MADSQGKHNLLYIGLAALAVVAGLLYYFRSQFVVASVNGEWITRDAYVKAMEAQGGKQILEQMIVEKLIKDEAVKQQITVDQAEIDTRIATIEANLAQQGQTLDAALSENSMTRDQLVEQIRIPLLIEKLAANSVEITDEEVATYIESNEELFADITDEEELQATARQQVVDAKTQQASQDLILDLQSKADIRYW